MSQFVKYSAAKHLKCHSIISFLRSLPHWYARRLARSFFRSIVRLDANTRQPIYPHVYLYTHMILHTQMYYVQSTNTVMPQSTLPTLCICGGPAM